MRASKPGESALLLLDVIDLLDRRGVGYAVVGAMAGAVYGAVRASLDADVVLAAAMPDAVALLGAYRAAGFSADLTRGDPDDPIPGLLHVGDVHGNRVDLLVGLKGLDPEAFLRVQSVSFHGRALRFVGREDFIAMKAFAGGPMDLLDAARAIAAAGPSLDADLVRRLAARYGREAAETLERLLMH